MRSRRRSRGRREPLFWSRACAQAFATFTGPNDDQGCDGAESQAGVVLFDPVAAQMNQAESRVTLRKLFWSADVQVVVTSVAAQNWSLCGVVFKNDGPVGPAAVTLSDLLGGGATAPKDILDVRFWPVANNYSGGNNVVLNGGQFPPVNGPFEINVQRKLEVEDVIVVVFFFISHFGASLAAAQSLSFSVNTVISALWQRTLR